MERKKSMICKAVTLSLPRAGWSCAHNTVKCRKRSHSERKKHRKQSKEWKTNSKRGKACRERREYVLKAWKDRRKDTERGQAAEISREGSTSNCLLLTWKCLKIICPWSNCELKILTYTSQRASSINRNIPPNIPYPTGSRGSFDLDWKQLSCNSEASHASLFQRPKFEMLYF